MVCDVIEDCKCYAFRGDKRQFCGVRKGPKVLLCSSDCCHGGCTDDGSRPPFRYIDREEAPEKLVQMGHVNILALISVVAILYLLYLNINLKTRRVR